MSDFDRIASSAPVNKAAALSSARGVEWSPERNFHEKLSDTPLPSKTCITHDLQPGQNFGRLTVVGKWAPPAGTPKKKAQGRYVVLCACGTYTVNRASVLKDGRSTRCAKCDYLAFIRAGMDASAIKPWNS